MKKLIIFLITLIVLIGGLIGGYFIGQNAETIKSWFEKDPTQQEQEKPGVDDPVIPEEPEKVEITDFAFYGNTVYNYSGTEKDITIPSSYSVEYQKVEEKYYTEAEDWIHDKIEGECLDYIYNWFQPIKITFDNEEVEPIFLSGGYWELANKDDLDFNIESSFPATIEFYEATYYEGDEFVVESICEYMRFSKMYFPEGFDNILFEFSTFEKVTLPSTIKQIDNYHAFNVETLKELVILNEDQVVTVGGPEDLEVPLDCKIYVPDSLYEDYIQSNNYPAERLYKLSELGEVA